jgi:hypothetical protein
MQLRQVPKFTLESDVEFDPTASRPGFQTRVVGMKMDSYVIIEHSLSGTALQPIQPNDRIWGRSSHGMLFRFRTRVIGILATPLPLLFVAPPDYFEEVNVRARERRKVFLPAVFSDPMDLARSRVGEGFVLDLSETGCQVSSGIRLPDDRDLQMSFQVPWTKEKFLTKARIIRSELTTEGFRSGVRFLEMDGPTQERLKHLLEFLQMEHLQSVAADPFEGAD